MTKWFIPGLLLSLLASGCGFLTFEDLGDDDAQGFFPEITDFEPLGSEPVLSAGDPPLEFRVEASDEDSFELFWVWEVGDGPPWAEGSTTDGFFDAEFSLSYQSATDVGYDPVGVRFTVEDPEGHQAQQFWWVYLDDGL
jgi:hypothetical protein